MTKIILILLVLGYIRAGAATLTGTVTRVIDGDTLVLQVTSNSPTRHLPPATCHSLRVRLADIDAPEISQPYGKVAKCALQNMVVGTMWRFRGKSEQGLSLPKAPQGEAQGRAEAILTVTYSRKDRYGRIIGTLFIDDVSINQRMVTLGHAWWYRKYSKNTAYSKLETTARLNNIGLWDLRSITSGFRSQVFRRERIRLWRTSLPLRTF